MLYTEAYKTAAAEMDKYYFEQHPDHSFSYYVFKQKLDNIEFQAALTDFMQRLDSLKFTTAPKNKEDGKISVCPDNIKTLWDAIKISCFLIAVPELNYKDLVYHNIAISLGNIYDLHSRFKSVLPAINDYLQTIVMSLHPNGVSGIGLPNEHRFFRASKSESALDSGISPSFVRRPLTYT